MKIALVASVGGHLTELFELSKAFRDHELVWILNDESPVLPACERVYRIAHAERDWRVLWNFVEVAAIFGREQPDVMVSTGAGPALPAAVVARAVGIPVIYIEATCAVTKLTLTGRLIRPFANRFYVQWEALKKAAPWARYVGGLQ